MKVELMREVLRLLDCYYEDMRYHAHISNVEGVNAVTNGTPEFDSEEELQDYLEEVHSTIGDVLQLIRDTEDA